MKLDSYIKNLFACMWGNICEFSAALPFQNPPLHKAIVKWLVYKYKMHPDVH